MNVPAVIVILFALRIEIIRCQPYSAFSCAMGRTVTPPRNQQVELRIFDLEYSRSNAVVGNYVLFYLHTKENPQGQQIIPNDTDTLRLSSFNSNRNTKIITHGYLASKDSASCTRIKDAFLSSGDYNVIVVDWWPMQSLWGTIPIDYWRVASYIMDIGKFVAKLINFLEEHGMDLKTTTLVGHSLGAHIMGIASYQARDKVNYIVGLDPALPTFEYSNASERLSADDAAVVEVIHTNEGYCGMSSPIGHYDFYPNGGSKQPGCRNNKCSHTRSSELYAESLGNVNAFYGLKCSDFRAVKEGNCFGDVAIMGGNMKSPSSSQGIFYLETSDSYPFSLG